MIDLIDAEENQMVWEGTARNALTQRARRDAAELIDQIVARMLGSFL